MLGNADSRVVFAEVVLDGGRPSALSPARRRRALDALIASGIVVERDGAHEVDGDVFAEALRDAREGAAGTGPARPRRTGIERFLDAEGRIDRYPSNLQERAALLATVAAAVLADGEVVGEREFSERLLRFSNDPALLRRLLVDHGVVERTRSGSEYALAQP